jgi:hypothetical protein
MGTLQRCDYFGMRSLLSDEPRACDVLATTPVVLAKIERKTLIEITGPLTELVEMSFTREVLTTARAQRAAPVPPACERSPRRAHFPTQVLSNVPLLSHLSEHEREAILEECTHREYQPGEVSALDCH